MPKRFRAPARADNLARDCYADLERRIKELTSLSANRDDWTSPWHLEIRIETHELRNAIERFMQCSLPFDADHPDHEALLQRWSRYPPDKALSQVSDSMGADIHYLFEPPGVTSDLQEALLESLQMFFLRWAIRARMRIVEGNLGHHRQRRGSWRDSVHSVLKDLVLKELAVSQEQLELGRRGTSQNLGPEENREAINTFKQAKRKGYDRAWAKDQLQKKWKVSMRQVNRRLKTLLERFPHDWDSRWW